jgi:predicted transcriptional regulator
VTAKEKLLERVTKLSEAEADETLRLLELRDDPVVVAFRDAPMDDEPWTDEDEAATKEADADFAAGRTVTHEEIKREFGIE